MNIENLKLRKKIIAQAKLGKHAGLFPCYDIEAASVYRIIQIANKKPYVAISASRKHFSVEENNKRHESLLADIKDAGLYAYQQIGGYEENGHQVVESSFFVPYNEKADLTDFIKLFQELQKKYDQLEILIGLPEGFDYKGWEGIKGLVPGGHYFVDQNGNANKIGTKATIQTFDKYGSIGIDPNKNRIIEWVIAGITTPDGSGSCFLMNRAGLRWFWDSHKQINPKEFSSEEKVQRALSKILR